MSAAKLTISQCFLIAAMTFSGLALAGSDPTAPLGERSSQQPQPVEESVLPKLQAVLCAIGNPCHAVLNGQVVNVSERVNGYRVVSIEEDHVKVSKDGKNWALSVYNQQVIQ